MTARLSQRSGRRAARARRSQPPGTGGSAARRRGHRGRADDPAAHVARTGPL